MLTFEPSTHTYRLGGRILPSVTQVLARFQDFSMIPPAVLESARIRGVNVHRMVELDALGNLDEATVAQAYWPYLVQWRSFVRETKFRTIASELRVYDDDQGFAGTLDLFGLLGPYALPIDIKTGIVPKTVGMQTAAYQWAGVLRRDIPMGPARGYLWLQPDRYRFRFIRSSFADDLRGFLNALELHKQEAA